MATFRFTDGPDEVFGGDTPGDNTWLLLKGEDTLFSGSGDDLVFGGWGNDFVEANRGADEVHGGDGSDYLSGGRGRDILYGENGNDQLWDNGDDGNDALIGGPGNDLLVTDGGRARLGTGADTLFVDLEAGHVSVIHALDFQQADHLTGSSTTPTEFHDMVAILDQLDRNDDRVLNGRDGLVRNGNLDLPIDGHRLVLHELTSASFDFLA